MVKMVYSGMQYRVGTGDKSVIDEILVNNFYLAEFLSPFLQDPGIVVDIGAQIGSFTVLAANTLSPSAVISVEPEEDSFGYLELNTRMLGIVHSYNIGLWDYETTLDFYITPSDVLAHTFIADMVNLEGVKAKKKRVKVTTLDKLLYGAGFADQAIKVIKIDAEGAEDRIFSAGQSALARTAVVVGEIHEAVLDMEKLSRALSNFIVAFGDQWGGPVKHRDFWAISRRFADANPEAITSFLHKAQLQSLRNQIHHLQTVTSDRESLISDIHRLISERDRLAAGKDNLTNYQLQALLREYQTSVSWRITAPLRTLGKLVVKTRNKTK
jgi:FkbM family methyltransferase